MLEAGEPVALVDVENLLLAVGKIVRDRVIYETSTVPGVILLMLFSCQADFINLNAFCNDAHRGTHVGIEIVRRHSRGQVGR